MVLGPPVGIVCVPEREIVGRHNLNASEQFRDLDVEKYFRRDGYGLDSVGSL
jgi:hypothetical protein